ASQRRKAYLAAIAHTISQSGIDVERWIFGEVLDFVRRQEPKSELRIGALHFLDGVNVEPHDGMRRRPKHFLQHDVRRLQNGVLHAEALTKRSQALEETNL